MSTYASKAVTALLLSLTFGFAVSQTVLSSALEELTRFYVAAAALVGNAVSGVNDLKAAQIPQSDRNEVRDELRSVSLAISRLRASQAPLIEDLSEYVSDLQAGKLDAQSSGDEWELILGSVKRVSGVVKTTLEVVEDSRWLKVTLDERDRLALREVLLGRASLLDRFSALPAPTTVEEIRQLDRMNRFYRQLFRSLEDLNVALTRATERIAPE